MQRILHFTDKDGRDVFQTWLASLRDQTAKAKILVRMNRLEAGNAGDCRPVGEGVLELRIHHGPGYRVYFGKINNDVVLLLCGGDKNSQAADIRKAKIFWAEYREKHDAHS
jgi:putative addiction module killer protein